MKMGMIWSIVFIFVSFFVLCNEVVVGDDARPSINYRNLQNGGVPCNRELGITINCQPSYSILIFHQFLFNDVKKSITKRKK